MLAVTVRADDFFGLGFLQSPFRPESDDLAGRDIVGIVTAPAKSIYFAGRVHQLGRGRIVLIVLVREGLAVTLGAADVRPRVAAREILGLVVSVTYEAVHVFNRSLSSRSGSLLPSGGFVKEQRIARIDHERRRSACSFGYITGIVADPDGGSGDRTVSNELTTCDFINHYETS